MCENKRNRFDKSKLNHRMIPPMTEVSFLTHAEYKEKTQFPSQIIIIIIIIMITLLTCQVK